MAINSTNRDGSTAWTKIETIHQRLTWARTRLMVTGLNDADLLQALMDIEQATRSIEAAIHGIVPFPDASGSRER